MSGSEWNGKYAAAVGALCFLIGFLTGVLVLS